jgi:thiol-disulfide isomerase/thioredoxin
MKYILAFFLFLPYVSQAQQKIETVDFSQLEHEWTSAGDSVVIVNFWATWCKPCVEELPEFEKLSTWIVGKKAKLLLVSLDFPKQLKPVLLPFVKRKKMKSKVVLLDGGNPNEWIDRVSTEWSGAIPATLIINPSKNFKDFREKQCSFEEIKSIIYSLLE